MNALDNGGGLRAWAKRHPSTTVKSLAGMKERLSAREGRVMIAPSQNTRRSRQQGRSGLWWSPSGVRAGASLQYLALLKHGGGDTPAGERKRRTTLKSYLLQEAEAASSEERRQMVRAG